jgi:hypothetical protein
MNAEWVASLQAEIRAMVAKAIAENPRNLLRLIVGNPYVIVALEDDEAWSADRGGNYERQSDDSRT